MRLIFLGPPGAGKGTQGERVATHFGIPRIATGDMMRTEAATGSDLGKQVQSYMSTGELVPDEITNRIAQDRIRKPDARKGFILDGYPRTKEQAHFLDEALEEIGASLDCVVGFHLPEEEIRRRLSGRRICPVCGTPYHVVTHPPKVDGICDLDGAKLAARGDDDVDSIRRRFEVYREDSEPLEELYRSRGLFQEVVATGTEDEVFERLLEVIAR